MKTLNYKNYTITIVNENYFTCVMPNGSVQITTNLLFMKKRITSDIKFRKELGIN